ncbi:putative peroxin 20 protein [Botrytis fragariae]|uniref:Putative peroxin 20 protein n=1 Tax=Botrytis fragariae TaxID=1964551 RepID=A0A8H6B2I5_9HELO|nr:putative peroxin 20 protein [Botrytis fragariae]KAF5877925.1 putative peroxin 20 protein [Botrytis fragariae]
MADNLCGPSNALQNFQKHSNVDRTLQQDRLVGRAPSSQGFRASPGPNAGQLDAEFVAFQAGHQSLSLSPSAQNFSPHHFQTPPPQSFQNVVPQHSAGQGWANDFQNMSISGPQAQFQQQGVHQTIQPQMGAGWHQEFAQSHGAPGMIAQGNQPMMAMSRPSMMNAGYNPMPRVLMQQNQLASTSQSLVENNEVFDEAAFARAFEQAANAESERAQQQELESQAAGIQHEETHALDQLHVTKEAELELDRAEKQLLGQSLLGADTIQDPATATSEQNTHAPDALSRTAGELLSSTRELLQQTRTTKMDILAMAAQATVEDREQTRTERKKNQSSEEKQKQPTAKNRLAQIAKTLPKQDTETAGTESEVKRLDGEDVLRMCLPYCTGDREQRANLLKMLRGEWDIREGGSVAAREEGGRFESVRMWLWEE